MSKELDQYAKLSSRTWARARLLGEARRHSNDQKRGGSADRGDSRNADVDLFGAIAEIALLDIIDKNGWTEVADRTRQHLFHHGGGKKVLGPDLILDRSAGIDAKSFDCSWRQGKQAPYLNKKVAINDNKHRNLKGFCDWYIVLIVPEFGCQGYFSRAVPYSEFDRLPAAPLKKGLQDSRNFPLEDFQVTQCNVVPAYGQLRADCWLEDEVNDLITDHRARLDLIADLADLRTYLERYPSIGADDTNSAAA